MFPLVTRKLIRGCQSHVNAGLGCAADYVADYIPLYAPFSGVVEIYQGQQGGNWLRLVRPNGDKIEFAHLSKYLATGGQVSEGQQIAITGNTGQVTTGPHAHIQIIGLDGKRKDPETYEWNILTKTTMKVTLVANKIKWKNLPGKLLVIAEWFKIYSDNRLEIIFDVKPVSFDKIPFVSVYSYKTVDLDWYRQNVTPLTQGHATALLVNPKDWDSEKAGFMFWSDESKPVRIALKGPESAFEERLFHEICHSLFHLTGQKDHYKQGNEDHWIVHDYLYVNPSRKKELLDLIDFQKLQLALNKINPQGEAMNQTKVVRGKDGHTLYVCTPIAIDFENFKKQAGVEGIIIPDPIPPASSL